MPESAIPEALSKLVLQRGVSSRAWFERGRLDLRVDDSSRVRLSPGRRASEVVLEAKLGVLPSEPVECEALLARVLLHVTANAGQQVGIVTISADGRRLLLQASVDGSDVEGFDVALEKYLNEIDRWLVIVRKFQA